MNISFPKESSAVSHQEKNPRGIRFNVTDLLNNKDPKNLKQKIFEILATGKGKLEITSKAVSLSISNLYEREKFFDEFQHKN